MQTLYRPNAYPTPIRRKIGLLPPLGTEIANRWMLGWPDRVRALLKSGEFLPALEAQEKAEREVLASEMAKHLSRHEIVQEYGLAMEPPTTSTSPEKTSAEED